jgi:O-antigen/teichoic acid export membrane protein
MKKLFTIHSKVKQAFFYTFGTYFFRISGLVTNLIVTNILGPSIMGVLNYLNGIDLLSSKVLYGTVRAANEREIPIKNSNDEKVQFASKSLLVNFYLFIIGLVIFISISIFSDDELIKRGAILYGIVNVAKGIFDYLRIYQKSLNKIKILSIGLILGSILQPLIILIPSKLFLLDGNLSGKIFFYLLVVVLMYRLFKTQLFYTGYKFPINHIKQIIKSGGPIVLNGLITTLLLTQDRFFIYGFLDSTDLGYYGVAVLMFQTLILIPNSLVGAYFPSFIKKRGDHTIIVRNISNLLITVNLFLVFIVYFMLPYIIKILLPDYVNSILTARIFLIGFYFNGVLMIYIIDLIRTNKLIIFVKYSAVYILFSWGIYYLGLSNFKQIEIAALITVFSLFVISIIAFIVWSKANGVSCLKTICLFLCQALPVMILFLDYFVPINKALLISLYLFVLIIIVYLNYANKTYDIIFSEK